MTTWLRRSFASDSRRRPGGDAGLEGHVGAVFTGDVDTAIRGADAEVAGGEGKGGAAHLADMGFAPVVAVVVAVAGVPVAGLLRGRGANIAARMRKRNAEDDEGGEADDEQTEAAHGADLAGWIRGWLHSSSLSCDWGDPTRKESTPVPQTGVWRGWGIRDLAELWKGVGVQKGEKCSGVDRGAGK